ncbi:metal ABC transporter ATP-binding protein [Candidatus Peregrinibacteria bacterium]|nr:metal ABC transporter ATP-binding protein [Candidatus Peregrinibacteria bacterium]
MIHTETVLEARDIHFSYGENTVLKGVTLAVQKGDYLGIVGPNGAGKTTLLKIMLGLMAPSQGTIAWFGNDIHQFKDWPKIGYVPQKATNFDGHFPATVYEVALMGRYGRRGLFHLTTSDDKNQAQKALEHVGMWELKDRLISDLSGGQQQRVFIARALAIEPEIIFLDEPTVGIDQQAKNDFYALLRKLNHELGKTLVLISHDIEMVTREVDHIACVDRELVCYSTPEEFLKNTRFTGVHEGEVQVIVHGHQH